MDKRLFHYTVGIHINNIIASGQIKVETDGGVDFNKQKPAVWSSFRSEWEPICNKMWESLNGQIRRLNKTQTEEKANGLYRIEITPESSPYNWKKWKENSKVSKQMYSNLLNSANDHGCDVELWRASFKPISKEDWIVVEKWNPFKKEWKEDAVTMWAL